MSGFFSDLSKPLFAAISPGHVAVVEALLEMQADAEAVNDKGVCHELTEKCNVDDIVFSECLTAPNKHTNK